MGVGACNKCTTGLGAHNMHATGLGACSKNATGLGACNMHAMQLGVCKVHAMGLRACTKCAIGLGACNMHATGLGACSECATRFGADNMHAMGLGACSGCARGLSTPRRPRWEREGSSWRAPSCSDAGVWLPRAGASGHFGTSVRPPELGGGWGGLCRTGRGGPHPAPGTVSCIGARVPPVNFPIGSTGPEVTRAGA